MPLLYGAPPPRPRNPWAALLTRPRPRQPVFVSFCLLIGHVPASLALRRPSLQAGRALPTRPWFRAGRRGGGEWKETVHTTVTEGRALREFAQRFSPPSRPCVRLPRPPPWAAGPSEAKLLCPVSSPELGTVVAQVRPHLFLSWCHRVSRPRGAHWFHRKRRLGLSRV